MQRQNQTAVDAVQTDQKTKGNPVALGAMDFALLGGSMGSVVVRKS
jgi:acetyl-CoA carboxylase beta subunit